jgi:hypothetical protein
MDIQITPDPSDDERQAIVEALRLEMAVGSEPRQWPPAALERDASQTFAGAARARRDAVGDAERRRSHDGSIG